MFDYCCEVMICCIPDKSLLNGPSQSPCLSPFMDLVACEPGLLSPK